MDVAGWGWPLSVSTPAVLNDKVAFPVAVNWKVTGSFVPVMAV
jgi:hypothetical protein